MQGNAIEICVIRTVLTITLIVGLESALDYSPCRPVLHVNRKVCNADADQGGIL